MDISALTVAECSEQCAVMIAYTVCFNMKVKTSKMAHFVFKCNKEDYLSI